MILLRNLVFLTSTFSCHLQRMPASGTVVIFIEFPVWRWCFWAGAECLCDVCERNHEDLHLPRPTVSDTRYESVFPSAPAVRQGHLGWYSPLLSAAEVPHWWGVWFEYPSDANYFSRLWSFWAILPELSRGVWPIRAFSPFSDSPDFWFVFFFCMLLITYHPQSMVVGSFVPALCPMDVGMLKEEDMAMTLSVVSGMDTSRSTIRVLHLIWTWTIDFGLNIL